MLLENQLTKLPYWDKLSEAERQLLRERAVLREYAKGQLVHGDASQCLGMVMVISGELRTYMLSDEGREITLFHLYPDDPCVFSASCGISQLTFETVIAAQQDTQLLVVGMATFSRLTEQNIYVRCFMYELIAQRFSTVMWTMQEILFKGFDRRLAGFLVNEYRRTGESSIRMTHEQIAQRTNSAREVVARMLKRFAADELVSMQRGIITLTDLPALEKLL